MKTNEKLNAIKNEVETVNKKLTELSEEEIAQVTGGDATQTIRAINQMKQILDEQQTMDENDPLQRMQRMKELMERQLLQDKSE